MILTFLGWVYIIMGIVILLKPEEVRKKFKSLSFDVLRKYIFVFALIFGLLLIKATWGLEGFLAKLFLLLGFVALVKAIYYLKAPSAQKMFNWWMAKDISFFRVSAIVQIVVGGLLLSI